MLLKIINLIIIINWKIFSKIFKKKKKHINYKN
jgi:hypothetical protein